MQNNYTLHTMDAVAAPGVVGNVQYGPDPLQDRLTPEEHQKLAEHLLRLLVRAEPQRQKRVSHMVATEIDLLGIVEPTGTDCERKNKREEAKDVSVPDAIYPFGWIEMQKMAAEISKIVFPAEAPYAVVAPSDKRQLAQALVKAFRAQGVRFDHRNNVQAAIFDAVALDLGAFEFNWTIARSGGATSRDNVTNQIAIGDDHAGMQIKQLNPYNVSWDQNCELPDLAAEGEFVAIFDRVTPFRVARHNQSKNFLDPKVIEILRRASEPWRAGERGYDSSLFGNGVDFTSNWFYYEPEIAKTRAEVLQRYGSNRNGVQTNFSGLFSSTETGVTNVNDTLHFTKMYVRIQPARWGLGPRMSKRDALKAPFQIWEIHLYGPGYIGFAAPIKTQLDMFPVAIASMNFRRKFGRSFKIGDHAAQLGLLASTMMNMSKRAMRKGLEGGLTVYNSAIIDLSDLDDMSGGRVPVRMQQYDGDLRRAIMQLSDVPDTKNSFNDVRNIGEIMGNMFPTSSQPAMVGLDRATTYQAQAVMATSMTNLLFFAAIIDGQLMVPARLHMHRYNLLNPADLTYLDEQQQSLVQLNSNEIANVEFELVQSQPLMGIDRLRSENIMRDVLNILMQSGGQLSPIQEFMLDHYVRTAGIIIDMEEYKRTAMQEVEAYQQQKQAETAEAEANAANAQAGAPTVGPATR